MWEESIKFRRWRRYGSSDSRSAAHNLVVCANSLSACACMPCMHACVGQRAAWLLSRLFCQDQACYPGHHARVPINGNIARGTMRWCPPTTRDCATQMLKLGAFAGVHAPAFSNPTLRLPWRKQYALTGVCTLTARTRRLLGTRISALVQPALQPKERV